MKARTAPIKRLQRRIGRVIDSLHPRSLAWNLKCRRQPERLFITRLGDSLKVRVWSNGIISRDIYVHKYFEPDLCKFVFNFLKPGMIFIDAGSNLGQYTLLAALKVGLKGRVHSFEPNPKMYGELVFNVELNNFQKICELNQLALADLPGKARLSRYEPGKEVYGSLGRHKRDEGTIIGYYEVMVTTLDRYVAEKGISHIDLIKMDIEGAELPALKGACKFLSRPDAPTFVIELSDANSKGFGYKTVDIWDYFESFGYRMYSVTKVGGIGEKAVKTKDFPKAQNLIAKKVLP